MADDRKTRVSFNLSQARRIATVVKRVEHTARNSLPPVGQLPASSGVGQVAVVKTTIGARSGSAPGVGTVTFKDVNSSGNYVDGLDDVPVKSPYATALSVGKWLVLLQAPGGWTVVGADC